MGRMFPSHAGPKLIWQSGAAQKSLPWPQKLREMMHVRLGPLEGVVRPPPRALAVRPGLGVAGEKLGAQKRAGVSLPRRRAAKSWIADRAAVAGAASDDILPLREPASNRGDFGRRARRADVHCSPIHRQAAAQSRVIHNRAPDHHVGQGRLLPVRVGGPEANERRRTSGRNLDAPVVHGAR